MLLPLAASLLRIESAVLDRGDDTDGVQRCEEGAELRTLFARNTGTRIAGEKSVPEREGIVDDDRRSRHVQRQLGSKPVQQRDLTQQPLADLAPSRSTLDPLLVDESGSDVPTVVREGPLDAHATPSSSIS
jgi:hypothetical protein